MTTVLGIETSCDETAAAVVRSVEGSAGGEILSNTVYSQIADHAAFGGVVPEIAARAHVEGLDAIVARSLADADVTLDDIDAVAVTAGPGLIGGLIVGMMTAKAICTARSLPLVAINHLEGHALTPRLTDGMPFPYLLLLVSGGHTQILLVRGLGDYERWGTTIDDALGEAFDKTAKLLGLPYPGGPAVEREARNGDATRFPLPRPMKGEERLDFSFSGLKSAVRRQASELAPLTAQDVHDLCASFQAAVTDTLRDRMLRALRRYRGEVSDHPAALVVAGGVAANQAIRAMLEDVCKDEKTRLYAPPQSLCSDNAAMIAWAGIEHLETGTATGMDVAPRSRWPLDEAAASLIGAGRRGAKA
ncbi:tRNA (adenosine(37)-N6)-threonylcarbamoyltransferase complex transferase subunit TsaD [Oricola cellulosilytica]|uniref:tRNA N6-adenosine threonylcarbamoyltransferase n=1 Tax=Oricola cellulosilytica TaxID=1429082 RepID=A0A4R0PDN9_9HYPH|nr:tRNA (adenosine(37)-N6)-threonylcarbamoyltransferase complex transferase subunit TsaD [Oricola cellulosilytica]TCD15887.1 tRNA (adenosine(37)-N6)-threonylcarbamoyltransferase complex transferase subunit TsaD [Oricola cellulosilytica]